MSLMTRFEHGAIRKGFLLEEVSAQMRMSLLIHKHITVILNFKKRPGNKLRFIHWHC